MMRNVRNRVGVTLVELLVVMSILVALTALALMLLPSFANNTATLAGTAEVQATLRNAQAMAASARLPRGVRFLPQNNTTSYICSELQYLEVPPIMIPDPQVLSSASPQFGTTPATGKPYVQLIYTTAANGTVTKRQCFINNLTGDQQAQVANGATLVLPTLGAWSRIDSNLGAMPNNEVILDVYPDSLLGAGTSYETFYFGVYGSPVPLLGEPVVVLPKNIGVDLQVSSPGGTAGQPYDVVFAPNGQTITTYIPSGGIRGANTGVYLWVRDYTKTPDMLPSSTSPWTIALNKFQAGGDQQIVGIRNGYVGTAPVAWPDNGSSYTSQYGPFAIALTNLK